MERDSGNLYVLEGVLMGLLLLGAAYAVSTLQTSSVETIRPRTELERLVGDALTVLAGLDDGNGTTLLDLYLAEALHCATDAAPSAADCDGRRSENLSLKLESYLPLGAGYAVGLGNGAAVREIYRSPLPQGEAVATSRTTGLQWNLTFVATELSCYEPGMDVNATLLPIDRGALAWARHANLSTGTTEIGGSPAQNARWWNVSLPAGTRPAAATLVANVTANATLPGAASFGSCDLQNRGAALRAALLQTPFAASAPRAPLGGTLAFDADLAALAAVPGITLGAANVTIYEPAPPRGHAPDTYVRASVVELTGSGAARSGVWTVPGESLYGAHPALLRVSAQVGGTSVELRRPLVVDVSLASGQVPIDAPYRVTLQAWLPDWG